MSTILDIHPSDDLDPDHYRKNSLFQFGVANELLDNYPFSASHSVLDIGCGDGKVTAEIARKVPSGTVLGVDISSSMIQYANEKFPKEKYPNLSFCVGNAEDLSYINQFHMCLSCSCLHWVRDAKAALRKMVQALRKDGDLLILTYPKESPYYSFLEETIQQQHWKKYAHLSVYSSTLTSDEYYETLVNLGIDIYAFQVEEGIGTYENKEDLISYVKGWLLCYAPLPSEEHQIFLNEAADRARDISVNKGDNRLHIPYKMLKIKGIKGY